MTTSLVREVMTTEVVTVDAHTGMQQIADLLVRHGISAVPVVDADHRVLGVVSEADLVARLEQSDGEVRHALVGRRLHRGSTKSGDTAGQLMSSPPVTVGPESSVSQAARAMEAARVRRLPVLDHDGRLIGIVSRRDLVRLFARTDDQLANVVGEAMRALWVDPSAVHASVRAGVVTLTGEVDRRSAARLIASYVAGAPGVVSVIDELTWMFDDRGLIEPGWYRSHPFSAETRPTPAAH